MLKQISKVLVETNTLDQNCTKLSTINNQKNLNKNTHQVIATNVINSEMDIILSITKFSEIYAKLKGKTTSEKGKIFELLTKFIFLLHPNYHNKTKNVWLYDDIPLKIKQKYKLPDKDKGIDLFLETIDNEFYAIQSKYRSDPFSTITWTSLATFTGQLFVNNIKKAIFVTNTFDIDEEISKCNNIDCLSGDFFNDDNLDKEFFDNIKKHTTSKQIAYKQKELFQYQQEAVNSTIDHFSQGNNRGYLSMSCGTGKTKTTQSIDKDMKTNKTLILVPSLYLLSQIYKEWSTEYFNDKTIKYLLVGSDMDTTNGKPPFLTTKESEIKEQLKYKKKLIVISTYQSCKSLENTKFDLIIFDEAHKTVGDTVYSFALFDKNVVGKYRLFVTATPKIYTKVNCKQEIIEPDSNSDSESDNSDNVSEVDSKESDESDESDEDSVVVSMDNEKLYGKCIYTYQLGSAIDDGKLTPFEIHMMYINNEQIKKFVDKKVTLDEKKNINFHYVATAMMLKEMFKNDDINHLLTYHSNLQNSKDFCKLLNDICNIDYIEHIDGSMSSKNKGKIVKEFSENDTAILTSSKVLNEGVNIPIVDSVCFVESRSSAIDIVQCVGRALRLYDGKTMSKIIIPILEDDVNGGKFEELVRIVKNLGAYDFNIKEMIMNKTGKNRKLIKIGCYKGDGGYEKIGEKIDLKLFEKSIESVIVSECYGWDNMYSKLIAFFEEHKRRPSSTSKNADEKKLGLWILRQLKNYRNNFKSVRTTQWKNIMDTYGDYLMNYSDEWDKSLKELILFFNKNKRAPLGSSKDENEKRLVKWIGRQKYNYENNTRLMKDKTKREQWEKLIEQYNKYFRNQKELWNDSLKEMIIFFDNNNRRPNDRSKNASEKKLAKWIGQQKVNYTYSRKAMKDLNKRKQWDDVNIKYSQYLSSTKK